MAIQYPKRTGVISKSYLEQCDRGQPGEPTTVETPQWVMIDGETYWGQPRMLDNRVVGVWFAGGPVVNAPGVMQNAGLMVVCPDCGNKRCPKATDLALGCTNSNEPGQAGSRYA